MHRGTSLLIPAPGSSITPHLWIVITEPDPACIIVSLTTLRNAKDQTVILRPGDHPFIRHDTVVFFADARIVDANHLQQQVAAGAALLHQPCTQTTLSLIQAGVLASPFTPRKVQEFYRTRRATQP